ncbi:hypothetical protein Cyast_0965 [Cyanobacterium stanieri PCC 7202]|uniref:Uncharacterized protein n=1 Tax=Cyanobacterium stanieri (strain ATCC 29140 / PCC 7202) TaxID=292563 RepID=K9YKE1_CYASC|nr:hypothetical protein Cyast_0965 [Cyanobacterium stanieri PCC 7202]
MIMKVSFCFFIVSLLSIPTAYFFKNWLIKKLSINKQYYLSIDSNNYIPTNISHHQLTDNCNPETMLINDYCGGDSDLSSYVDIDLGGIDIDFGGGGDF